ncbi:hypothetical protein [Streptomyces kronopolitis]|uniref:hypothetical protein n=1 Tax=Streptomyces kronopolitis TaxID=1612435 RepID=UPI003D975F6D
MPDKDVEPTDERIHPPEPWWADIGAWGAIAMTAFGALLAAWVFLRLPGTPPEPAYGYYGASKVIALGLVIVGSTLLTRRRARATSTEETDSQDGPQSR